MNTDERRQGEGGEWNAEDAEGDAEDAEKTKTKGNFD
jgi:hypothetical protein